MAEEIDMGVVVRAPGGPEALEWSALETAAAGPGEVRILQRAIGVNFIDTYFRNGLYPWPSTPLIPGAEAAGVVAEIGAGVDRSQGGRPRGLHAAGGRLSHAARRCRRAARQASRRDCIRRGRVGDAQGIDGAISAHLVLSGQGGRHRAGACGGRRRRLAAGTVVEVTGRDMRSGRRDRPTRRQSPRPTAIPTSSTTAPRISSPASRRSPVPGAAMWFTIRSARTPGAARSNP